MVDTLVQLGTILGEWENKHVTYEVIVPGWLSGGRVGGACQITGILYRLGNNVWGIQSKGGRLYASFHEDHIVSFHTLNRAVFVDYSREIYDPENIHMESE